MVDKGKSKQESPSMGTGSEASEVGALRPSPQAGRQQGCGTGLRDTVPMRTLTSDHGADRKGLELCWRSCPEQGQTVPAARLGDARAGAELRTAPPPLLALQN